ncbi:MAG: hypothetical protein ACHQF2_00510 [Flavobacteriales bacterium]
MISIKNPCQQNISSFPRCGNTLYCGICEKNVTDLSKKTTAEVVSFTSENKEACVIIHSRHEETTTKKYTWINRVENKLVHSGWKRTAFATVMVLLFLASCASRRKPHKVGRFSFKAGNEKESVLSFTKQT